MDTGIDYRERWTESRTDGFIGELQYFQADGAESVWTSEQGSTIVQGQAYWQ
jgi:hypothetical protein